MSMPKKPKDIIKSPVTHLDDGLIKKKLSTSKQMEDIEDMQLKKKKKPEKKLYTLELALRNKNKICKDKSNILGVDFLNIKLSKTLEAGLITDEKGLKPFWNLFSQTMSKRSWSSLKTDCPDSAMNLSKTSVDTMVPNSQLFLMKQHKKHKKNLQKTSYQSLRYSRLDSMEKGNIQKTNDKNKIGKDTPEKITYNKISRSIKFKPSDKLRNYLNQCFGTHRYFYNGGLYLIKRRYEKQLKRYQKRKNKNKCCYISPKKIENKKCSKPIEDDLMFCKEHRKKNLSFKYYDIQELRDKLIIKQDDHTDDTKWQKNIPYDIKQNALRLVLSNLKSAISNKKKSGNKFDMRYLDKKSSQIIKLPSSFINLKEQTMLTSYGKDHTFTVKNNVKKWMESVKYKLNDTVTIKRDGKHYYIYASYDVPTTTINKPFQTASIDLGVRNFSAIYSPDGVCGYMGKDMTSKKSKIGKLCKKIDKLKSYVSKGGKTDNQGQFHPAGKKTLNCMKTKVKKISRQIKGKINNLHNQLVNFLCLNFHTVIVGKFDPSKKVKKSNRNISSQTTRSLLSLSHYRFMEKLKAYGERIKTNIIVSSEEYTSKTCGLCGALDDNLGSSKTYSCKLCPFEMDRDLNGARNIYLKTVANMIRSWIK